MFGGPRGYSHNIFSAVDNAFENHLWSCPLLILHLIPLLFSSSTMPTSCPLKITVIGAGICGLAAATFLSQSGHKVTVLESNSFLSEIGAGIQATPNALRIFDRHGLKEVFYKEGTKNEGALLRRWDNGKLLGKHRGMPMELYGYLWVLCAVEMWWLVLMK